jgi:hypothetical protein
MSQGKTGVRGFGGDASGLICYSQDGSSPPNTIGQLTPNVTTSITLE